MAWSLSDQRQYFRGTRTQETGTYDIGEFIQCNHYVDGQYYDQADCPRCGGRGYYYDFSFTGLGDVRKVSGATLLSCLVRKVISTVKGSNAFHPEYGTLLEEYIGSIGSVESLVSHEVLRAVGLVARYQRDQLMDGQILSDEERLDAVDGLEISSSSGTITVKLRLRNKKGTSFSVSS